MMTNRERKQANRFLYRLQASGKINMFGAPKVLQDTFGFDRTEARQIFQDWGDNWSALYYDEYKKETE